MSADSFVHLHLHTEYSLLDGAVRIPELMQKVKEHGMPAAAITDHGNMFGVIEFYQEAQKAGVKPIIGCEVYMAPASHRDRGATNGRDAAYHFTLLAKDLTGYANLIKLVSIAHLDGMYYKPRIDKELLAQHSAGLIGLSGCLKGEVNSAIVADNYPRALELAGQYRDILGAENFFLEMHDHGIEQQLKCNRVIPRIGQDLGLGLVGANDVHFLERSHHEAHDVMICIGTGANVADERRMKYTPELFLKSPAEMAHIFRDHPEAVTNTLAIAERCDLKIEFGTPKYPNFTPPEGITQTEHMRQIVYAGLIKRYGERAMDDPVVVERIERELALLESQGFVNYFLIVWDFIAWAKARGIPVGPGRGSAAGSMAAYAMGITDIDPIRYKLLFERFLNPERVSPPDIDVDFCVNRRSEVIEYVRQKYGDRAVSQIVTFGTMGAKSVVRDVARVLGWSYGDGDRMAKMVPNELGITLAGHDEKNKETGEKQHVAGAIDKNPELKKAVEEEPATKQLWEYATTLEGLTRGVGVHAAGVVISDRDLSEYIPLTRANDGSIVSQYAMGPLTDLGMLKMDFLGLKTLTVITDAVVLIRQRVPDFDIDTIPLQDQPTFDLLNRGETIAIFQLESGGMVNVCRQFNIADIEDINAILALYRPGPMDLIPDYIKRKKGLQKIKYAHKLLETVTADTYGIFVYQEQVMAAASVLAGYTLGGADLLRRAMGKKDKEKMAKEREKFVKGCKELNDIDPKKANDIFDLLEKFAGYGFNRSHSAAYAWVSYQTAFLKANYPVEFMAAVMSNEVANTDKISIFVAECSRLGITILAPEVNKSGLKFVPEEISVEGVAAAQELRRAKPPVVEEVAESDEADLEAAPVSRAAERRRRKEAEAAQPRIHVGSIRYGLAAIKNVSEAAMESAIAEREERGVFKSLEDFCGRIDSKKLNKKSLESLVKCGAFDWCEVDRAQLFAEIDSAFAAAASSHRDRAAGQSSLFDAFESDPAPIKRNAPAVPPWSSTEKLSYEKELLGFYVTGHPLDDYRPLLESGKFTPIAQLGECEDKSTVSIAGALTAVDKKFTKKESKPFAVVTLEDLTGTLEVMIWNEAFVKAQAHLVPGNAVSISGRLDQREEAPRISANEVKPLNKPAAKSSSASSSKGNAESAVVLSFDRSRTTEADLTRVREVVKEHPGTQQVELNFTDAEGHHLRLRAGKEFRMNLTPDAKQQLANWLS
jgi:DNA polymerase-3 subunit alpha